MRDVILHLTTQVVIKINIFCLTYKNSRSFVLFNFNVNKSLNFVKVLYQPNKKCIIVLYYYILQYIISIYN